MKKLKLLVIDDESEIREAIRFFAASQYEIFEASNGADALDLICNQHIDLIVSDYNMPKMDGLEFLKVLAEKGITVPIVWLTGRGSSDLCRNSWALGVYDYMEKPFSPEDLLNCLSGAAGFARSIETAKEMGAVSRHLFEKAQLMLGARSYRAFEEACLKEGVSPSSMVDRLIENYMKGYRSHG